MSRLKLQKCFIIIVNISQTLVCCPLPHPNIEIVTTPLTLSAVCQYNRN